MPTSSLWGMNVLLIILFWSAVHDHLHSQGKTPTTFFRWTGSNVSPLYHWAEQFAKMHEAAKAKKRNRR